MKSPSLPIGHIIGITKGSAFCGPIVVDLRRLVNAPVTNNDQGDRAMEEGAQ